MGGFPPVTPGGADHAQAPGVQVRTPGAWGCAQIEVRPVTEGASGRSTAVVAAVFGLRKSQVMRLVLLPQAVRRMLPVLIAQLVVLLKDSSLGFIIGYFELLRQARSLVEFFTPRFGNEYTFQLYVAAGLIYIVINVLLSQLAKYVEKRTRRNRKTAGTSEVPASAEAPVGTPAGPA